MRTSTKALVVLGLSAGLLQAIPSSATPVPSDAPITFTGSLPSGVDTVYVYPNLPAGSLETKFVERPLAEVDADLTGGNYTLHIDPRDVPAKYFNDEGVVNFRLYMAKGSEEAWTRHLSARAVHVETSESEAWLEPTEAIDALVDPADSHAGRSFRTAILPRSLRQRGIQVLPAAKTVAKRGLWDDETEIDDGVDVPTLTPTDPQATPYCHYNYTGKSSVRSTTVGTTYPVGASEARMTVTRSKGGSYGVASKLGDNNYFSASGTKWLDSGWEKEWIYRGVAASYRIPVEYRYWKVMCFIHESYEWQPYQETGGDGVNTNIERPSFTKCSDVSNGMWRRSASNGKAYHYGAGVKFKKMIGLDLSVTTQYSEGQKLEYSIAGTRKKQMCGSGNDWPSVASKVMERFHP